MRRVEGGGASPIETISGGASSAAGQLGNYAERDATRHAPQRAPRNGNTGLNKAFATPRVTPPPVPQRELDDTRQSIERELRALFAPSRAPDHFAGPWKRLAEYVLRRGKRLRPALLLLGWRAGGGRLPAPAAVYRFAAGIELLHAFILAHDDVADRAQVRRGGPALHEILGGGRLGDNLAVVAGDLLLVESIAVLLGCRLPNGPRATRELLASCRITAVGQFMDLSLADLAPEQVTPAAARAAASMKTARYSFEGPLVAGAMLSGARPEVIATLRAVARPLGLGFQLRDDLLPFCRGRVTDKPITTDLEGGKKTWLFTIAWRALDQRGRARLERCLHKCDLESLATARGLFLTCGAFEIARREVHRLCDRAGRAATRIDVRDVRVEAA
ncbi:MAG: polyprenyl synthetase family protein [Deltaproteobacteria bacterium]|nr:MAG: polyprenyl synthetase family protein [Deltaproteobacteria bacterium]